MIDTVNAPRVFSMSLSSSSSSSISSSFFTISGDFRYCKWFSNSIFTCMLFCMVILLCWSKSIDNKNNPMNNNPMNRESM